MKSIIHGRNIGIQLVVFTTVVFLIAMQAKAVLRITDPPYNAIAGDAINDDAAFQAALNHTSDFLIEVPYSPNGSYKISQTLTVKGPRTIIGVGGKTQNDNTKPSLEFTGTGPCMLVSNNAAGNYNPVHIENLMFTGGPASGGGSTYAIDAQTPFSVFKGLYFNSYTANAIRLGQYSTTDVSCWGTSVVDCRAYYPSGTSYKGLVIDVNGGNILVDNWISNGGDVGIDVQRGENIVINNPFIDKNYYPYTSGSIRTAIRLAGSGQKNGVAIIGGYLETSQNGIVLEAASAVTIKNVFIDDLGYGGRGIYIEDNDVKNVSITDCTIRSRAAGGHTIDIGTGASSNNIFLSNNELWDASNNPKPLNNAANNAYTNIEGSKHKGLFTSEFRYNSAQYDVSSPTTKTLVQSDLNKAHLIRSGASTITFNLPHAPVGCWVIIGKNSNSINSTIKIDPSGSTDRIHGISGSGGKYIQSASGAYSTTLLVADETGWIPVAYTPNWTSEP